ncbi:unnamed protein product [Amoebophrya sp. A120]|nr:unnamed protein product [Amoebophrya sp. A120]|eukprot:GSA120T00013330001.1
MGPSLRPVAPAGGCLWPACRSAPRRRGGRDRFNESLRPPQTQMAHLAPGPGEYLTQRRRASLEQLQGAEAYTNDGGAEAAQFQRLRARLCDFPHSPLASLMLSFPDPEELDVAQFDDQFATMANVATYAADFVHLEHAAGRSPVRDPPAWGAARGVGSAPAKRTTGRQPGRGVPQRLARCPRGPPGSAGWGPCRAQHEADCLLGDPCLAR